MVDVSRLTYKPGWQFKIGGPLGAYLCVLATTPDSLAPERRRCTQHMFRLPDLDTDSDEFARWVFSCLLLCELHEAGEFFKLDGVAPFFPYHQDEGSPYDLVDRRSHDGAQPPCSWPEGDRLRSAVDLLRRRVSGEVEPDHSAG